MRIDIREGVHNSGQVVEIATNVEELMEILSAFQEGDPMEFDVDRTSIVFSSSG